MGSNIKKSTFMIILGFLTILTIFVSVLFWYEMKTLNNAYSDMNQIEFLSSSTQRLISIAQTDTFLQKDVFFIGDSTKKALTPNLETSISVFSNDLDMIELAEGVLDSWNRIDSLLQEEPINTIDLGLARDDHFKSMTNLTNGINTYAKEVNNKITEYQISVLVLFFLIGIIMLDNLLRTHTELKQTHIQAQNAQLDSATGLFNRSRCQELFKSNQKLTSQKSPAFIVIDLNDLKKTNDTLGHRVGDELIASFAKVLKNACQIHQIPPFMGRYGGDEFIIYYEDIAVENDIKAFLKEVDFLAQKFNDDETRFQLAYAAGYSYLVKNSNEELTLRELFDKADESMYENKIAMKKCQN